MSKQFFVELFPRTAAEGAVHEIWVSGDEDLATLVNLASRALKTDVAVLYHSKTKYKVLSLQDVSTLDVLIATKTFDSDPFQSEKDQVLSKPASRDEIATVKISILGMPRIGKSALALRFSHSDFFSNYETTIEEEFECRIVVGGATVDVSVLDTAGQEAFQALRSNWIKEFSVENPNLKDLKEFVDLIELYGDPKRPPPIALVATKIDLLKGSSESNAIYDMAAKYAEQNRWMFFKTSAMGNVGVKETFEALICKVLGISLDGPFSPGGRGDVFRQNDPSGPDGQREFPGLIPCPPETIENQTTRIRTEEDQSKTKAAGGGAGKKAGTEGGFFSRMAKLLCG